MINPLYAGLGRPVSRRTFVKGVMLGAVVGATGFPRASWGSTRREVHLTIARHPVNITGRSVSATLINGQLPGPVLHFTEGDEVAIHVHNALEVSTAIHWHGIILPAAMDGVPGISPGFSGIAPGQSFTYRFTLRQSGTYWYHAHAGFQEQTGVYGAMVVHPAQPASHHADRSHTILLSDWTNEQPDRIVAKLKKRSHYYNTNERTHRDILRDVREKGVLGAWRDRQMWGEMRMSSRDLADVTAYTYTYLMNGMSPAQGWEGLFQPHETLLLRLINGSAMTFFDFRIPDLPMTVIEADGQPVEPVTVDEIRIGVGETYDVLVRPHGDRPYTLFAQDLGRSGFVAGTLTPRTGERAAVPTVDPIEDLTHADMGMSHLGAPAIRHAESEYGPHVDMRAESPAYRLDDPGIGLRNNGRRVLTYADLRHAQHSPDMRDPTHELEMHLTGNMHRYLWSIDGVPFEDSAVIRWEYGARVRITFVNDTMMNHPMHLHGMWSDVETGDEHKLPRKHTVVVQPGAKISYRVTADALGPWAFHCHMLYHMMGMFRTVHVERVQG